MRSANGLFHVFSATAAGKNEPGRLQFAQGFLVGLSAGGLGSYLSVPIQTEPPQIFPPGLGEAGFAPLAVHVFHAEKQLTSGRTHLKPGKQIRRGMT
jgi:hypothetical protein